jgi:hypothetical protein
MSAYVLVVIWAIGALLCFYIARARGVRGSLFVRLVAVILGPLGIPLVFLAKPTEKNSANE